MNLYNLTGNFLEVQKMIEDDGVDNQVLLDTLESLEGSIEVKAENTVYVIENARANSKVLKDAIDRLQKKLDVLNNNIKRTEEFLFGQLELMGKESIKAGIFNIKKINNPRAVYITDPKLVPAEYQTIVPEIFVIRKLDIGKDLRAGKEVPGAVLTQTKRWKIS
jgi:predicted nuclease with TOPRIM domain